MKAANARRKLAPIINPLLSHYSGRHVDSIQKRVKPSSIRRKKRDIEAVGRLKSFLSLIARVGSREKRRRPASP